MPQLVCRIQPTFAPSLAQGLRGVRELVEEPARGDAIYVGRHSEGARIEIRSDGTLTYDATDRAVAIVTQALRGILPAPQARYVLGLDEAGIGGESAKPHAAAVLLSADVRAELIARGLRDGKTVGSPEELSRLATLVRENATYQSVAPLAGTAPGQTLAASAARAMATLISEFLERGFTTEGLKITVDQTDEPALRAALGPLWDELQPLLVVKKAAETEVEVAAASILARQAAAAHPATVPPKPKSEPATHPFSVGQWKPADKDQIIEFLRRLDLSYPDIAVWIDKGGKIAGIWDSIEKARYNLLVARVGNEVAGFSLTQKKDERNWKMSTFFVAPPYRKRNIGPRLLKEEIYRLAQAKCRRLMVTFGHEEFHNMQPFLTEYGFTCDGISPQRYRDNSYEVVMAKRFQYRDVDAAHFIEFVQNDVFRMTGSDIVPLDERTFFAVPKQALFAIHQLKPERRYVVRATTSEEPENELAEIREIAATHDALPILAALYGLPADAPLPKDVLVLDAFQLETQFYPIHLDRPAAADLIIPIKPEFANRLFPDKKQSTFGPSKFGLREDHVYYRVDKGAKGLRRGARLFWYVSDPKQEVIGSARLRELKRGQPRKLFHQFGGLGAWNESDIEEHTAGGDAMALVFEWFRQALPKPSFEDVRSVIPTFNPVTVFAITHDQGDKLLHKAGI